MKKWIALMLSLLLVFGMAACSSGSGDGEDEREDKIDPEALFSVNDNAGEKSTDDHIEIDPDAEENDSGTKSSEPIAVDFDYTGTCGEDAQWGYVEETGALTIIGTGNMNDFIAGSRTQWRGMNIKSVSFHGVTSIGAYAFEWCENLTEITIGDSVTCIGEGAFVGCSGLTEITIPDSVTSIDAIAFRACTGLTEITIGNGVTSIGEYAFHYCTGLTEATIPDGVITIEANAFNECSSLSDVYYGGTREQWEEIEIGEEKEGELSNATIHYAQ